jgi:hypothetical protein
VTDVSHEIGSNWRINGCFDIAVDHADGVRLYVWTEATNGPIVHPQMIGLYEYGATVELYWQGKTEELGEKLAPVPLCRTQIPHGLTWVSVLFTALLVNCFYTFHILLRDQAMISHLCKDRWVSLYRPNIPELWNRLLISTKILTLRVGFKFLNALARILPVYWHLLQFFRSLHTNLCYKLCVRELNFAHGLHEVETEVSSHFLTRSLGKTNSPAFLT